MEKLMVAIGSFLYKLRLVMACYYIGLSAIMFLFVSKFMTEVFALAKKVLFDGSVTKIQLVIKVLELVDLVMVVQLVWVVTLAGYSLFVTSRHFEGDKNLEKPDWLDHVNTYNLKLKLAFAIISISGVHALKTFLEGPIDPVYMGVIAGVHLVFVGSAIGIAYAERLTRTNTH